MGGFFSAPDIPAPPPAPPVPAPEDPEKAAREARIKALIRRRRGRAGLVATGERGVLVEPAGSLLPATRLGE